MRNLPKRRGARTALAAAVALAAGLAYAATASAAAPQNTALPTIAGTARAGSTLSAADGTWANGPSTYAYQWQRCADDGTSCGDITGATSETYALVAGDVGHAVRVVVTASNADGKTAARSDPSAVVASANGPTSSVQPTVTGTATVGDTLTVSDGSWSPTPSSYRLQWQRCASDGTGCVDIGGATGRSYGVRASDVGHRLRALVTARTATDQATAASNETAAVAAPPTVTTTQTTTVTATTTQTTTVTVPAPGPPTIRFLSLRRAGSRIEARFRLCAQAPGLIRITERDNKARALPYTRHLAARVGGCGTFSRSWLLLPRYRRPGRLLVTLRATDAHGRLSRLATRSIAIR